DIDSREYQAADRGIHIRSAVTQRTGSPTIPQIFINGELVGGANEVFDAFKDGRLQQQLAKHGVAYDRSVELDPNSLLPNWLQPRDDGKPVVCEVPPRK